jgi:hypothetical protein
MVNVFVSSHVVVGLLEVGDFEYYRLGKVHNARAAGQSVAES